MPAGWLGGVRPCKQSSPPFPPLPNESPPRTPHRSPAFVWHKGDAQPPGRALAFGEGRCPPLDPSGLGEVSFSSFLPFSLCLGTENQKTEALASKEAKAVPFAPGGRSGESSLPVLGTGARRRRGAGRTDGWTDGRMDGGCEASWEQGCDQARCQHQPRSAQGAAGAFWPFPADSKGPRAAGRVSSAGMGTAALGACPPAAPRARPSLQAAFPQ